MKGFLIKLECICGEVLVKRLCVPIYKQVLHIEATVTGNDEANDSIQTLARMPLYDILSCFP